VSEYPEVDGYPGWAVLVSAVVGLAAAVLAIWAASGFALSTEAMFRVAPTVEGGGVGAEWVTGNQIAWLDFLVALTHAADVIMGLFILFMVFLHWASFRRLAARMRTPGERRREAVAPDGGEANEVSRPSSDATASDGGADARAEPAGAADRDSGATADGGESP
jgi:hypothetical protein